eukprot:TRINITY_DN4901_c0_g1_i1.p1 TRINITY_DN4901_c0_g1~~TRINITY_DN4901_c0_g1_i1.p1  ORF type:complete len:379 (-),score=91.67 TRINITY_DN4901_c0_g1_i1:48-1184(-)
MFGISLNRTLYVITIFLLFSLWWRSVISLLVFILLCAVSVPVCREITDLIIKKTGLSLLNPSKYAIFITGASRGLGKSTAKMLVDSGFTVFATVRNPQDAATLREYCAGSNGHLEVLLMDVGQPSSIHSAVATLQLRLQHLNCPLLALINNAGVLYFGVTEAQPIETFQQTINTNLLGHIRVTQAVLPLLQQTQAATAGVTRGRIINITSIAGFMCFPFMTAYNASKAALDAVCDTWRRELAHLPGRVVDVVSIQPGFADSDMGHLSHHHLQDSDAIKELRQNNLLDVYGDSFERGIKTTSGLAALTSCPSTTVARAVQYACQVAHTDLRTRYLVGDGAVLMPYLNFFIPTGFMCNFVQPFLEWFVTKLRIGPHFKSQ